MTDGDELWCRVAAPRAVVLLFHGMVLPMLSLPAELQADFLLLVADERTAGRLAQASRKFKQQLPQPRLRRVTVESWLYLALSTPCASYTMHTQQRTERKESIRVENEVTAVR